MQCTGALKGWRAKYRGAASAQTRGVHSAADRVGLVLQLPAGTWAGKDEVGGGRGRARRGHATSHLAQGRGSHPMQAMQLGGGGVARLGAKIWALHRARSRHTLGGAPQVLVTLGILTGAATPPGRNPQAQQCPASAPAPHPPSSRAVPTRHHPAQQPQHPTHCAHLTNTLGCAELPVLHAVTMPCQPPEHCCTRLSLCSHREGGATNVGQGTRGLERG